MDIDTLILIGLLAAALCWWLTIHVKTEKQLKKQWNKNAQDQLERAEKVRRLNGKL